MDMQELERELAELEARKAEIDARRAEKAAEAELREKVRAARREIEDAELIEKYEAELGELGKDFKAISTDEGLIIVRRPHPATYKRFRDRGKYTTKDVEEFARPGVVYPDAQKLTDILNKYPAVLDLLADAAHDLAVGRSREIAGK